MVWVVCLLRNSPGMGQKWDDNGSSNEQTKKLVPDMGGKAHTYTVDVTNRDDVYRKAELVRKDLGRDIIHNTGGVADCPDELIERTMKVNCHALFWVRTLWSISSSKSFKQI